MKASLKHRYTTAVSVAFLAVSLVFAPFDGNANVPAETSVTPDAIRLVLPYASVIAGLPARAVVTDFTGNREGRSVRLEWVCAREINNRGFEVQRASSVSRGWETLTLVPGFGTSGLEQTYRFTDRNAPPEDVRYMLRILGNDGVIQYSQIITVPAGSMLRSFTIAEVEQQDEKVFRSSVELTEGGVTALSVVDHKGYTLLRVMGATRLDPGKHEFVIDCSKVPSGRYQLLLHTPEGRYSRELRVP